jgi:hypothetical protein
MCVCVCVCLCVCIYIHIYIYIIKYIHVLFLQKLETRSEQEIQIVGVLRWVMEDGAGIKVKGHLKQVLTSIYSLVLILLNTGSLRTPQAGTRHFITLD